MSTDDDEAREQVLAEFLAEAILHDDLSAKVRVAQLLNYSSDVKLSLVYRVGYLVRDAQLAALVPDFPPPTQNGDSE